MPDDTTVALTKRQARDNTKVELLAEAIEDFMNVVVDARVPAGSRRMMMTLPDARESLRLAIREFMAPNLKLVIDGVHQVHEIPEGETRPTCLKCLQRQICRNPICPDWHRAIQVAVNTASPVAPRGGDAA